MIQRDTVSIDNKRQRKRSILFPKGPFTLSISDNSAMRLDNSILIEINGDSLENELQPHPAVTLLFSMRTESQASSQIFRSVDTDVWCKWGLWGLGCDGYLYG